MSNLQTLAASMAERFGMGREDNDLLSVLKNTAFRANATDSQMAALLIVANQYGLNPFTKEIYAFPDKNNGIIPIVGVDGWSRIINSHPHFDGMEFSESSDSVESKDHRPCPAWMECKIYRKDRTHPVVIREYLDECYRPPFQKDGRTIGGPWQTHTKRFLRHKTMIQCARIAFGFVGIFDEDEATRIKEDGTTIDMGPADVSSKKEVRATTITPTDGATARLEKPRLEHVTFVANTIVEKWNAGDEWGAFEEAASVEDADEKVALWALLKPRSDIRNAIKRMAKEADKVAPANPDEFTAALDRAEART